jgi:hypothetical protein
LVEFHPALAQMLPRGLRDVQVTLDQCSRFQRNGQKIGKRVFG